MPKDRYRTFTINQSCQPRFLYFFHQYPHPNSFDVKPVFYIVSLKALKQFPKIAKIPENAVFQRRDRGVLAKMWQT